MANTIRTEDDLFAIFADNVSRDITAQDARDFIASAFGAEEITDPTVNDDNVGTAGNGSFDANSRWLNTATPSIWQCVDGTPGAAVWVKIFPAEDGWFYALITAAGLNTTALQRTGVAASWGSGSGVNITSLSDFNQCAIGEFFQPGGSFSSGFIQAVDPSTQSIIVDPAPGSPGGGPVTINPLTYGFDEYSVLTSYGQLKKTPGGRTGDGTNNPACNISTKPLFEPGDFVLMRFRGVFNGADVYEFKELPFPSLTGPFGDPAQPSPLVIDYFGGPGGNVTTINWNANVNINAFINGTLTNFIVNGAINFPLFFGGGGAVKIIKYVWDFSDATVLFGGSKYRLLDTLTPGLIPAFIYTQCTSNWIGLGTGILGVVNSTDQSQSSLMNGVQTNTTVPAQYSHPWNNAALNINYCNGNYFLAVSMGSPGAIPTAGRSTIWVVYHQLG
jgi:hypothetical protein